MRDFYIKMIVCLPLPDLGVSVMNRFLTSFLCGVSLFLFSCASEPTVSDSVLAKIDALYDRGRVVNIKPVDLNEFTVTQRQFDMGWFYDDFGTNTKFYPSKVTFDKIKKRDYYKLLKRAYIPSDEEFRYKHKKAAIKGLEYSIYPHLYANLTDKNYASIRNIVYTPDFMSVMFKLSPSIVGYLPYNLSNYYELVFQSLRTNSRSYYSLPLVYKSDPTILKYLFYQMNTNYQHPYQSMAIQYANYDLTKEFLSRNGLLLDFVNSDHKDDALLVYTALLQNDRAIQFASPRLRRIVETNGAESLKGLFTSSLVMKEKLSDSISYGFFESLKAVKSGWDVVVGVSVSLYNKGISLITGKPEAESFVTDEDDVDNRKLIVFRADDSIITDLSLVLPIEALANRRLLHLWRIAVIDQHRDVFIAYYQPIGKRYLSSIIYRNKDAFTVANYKALLTRDGSSIWRVNDKGSFSPNEVSVVDIEETSNSRVFLKIKWKSKLRSSLYLLKQKDSQFIKEFIAHTEEFK